jgi:hypothetical protein
MLRHIWSLMQPCKGFRVLYSWDPSSIPIWSWYEPSEANWIDSLYSQPHYFSCGCWVFWFVSFHAGESESCFSFFSLFLSFPLSKCNKFFNTWCKCTLPFELQFVLLSLKKHIRESMMIASRHLGYPWLVCLCYDNHPILCLIFSDFCNYVCFVSTCRWWMYHPYRVFGHF